MPDDGLRREYLVVWAGDNNVLDRSGAELTDAAEDRSAPT